MMTNKEKIMTAYKAASFTGFMLVGVAIVAAFFVMPGELNSPPYFFMVLDAVGIGVGFYIGVKNIVYLSFLVHKD